MRSFPFDTDAAQGLAALVTITRFASTLRFTTHSSPVTTGGYTWVAAPGAKLSDISFPGDGSPSNLDISVMATPGGIIEQGEATRGLFDQCPVTVELFDPNDIASGTLDIIPGGYVGDVRPDDFGNLIIPVNGPLRRTMRATAEHYSLTGRESLGDDRCKVPIRPADIARSTAYVLPTVATGLLRVDDAYGRVRSSPTSPDVEHVEDYANVYYECTVAGTTDATAPTYPTTPGNTVVDGTATFICRDSWLRYARGQAVDLFTIQFDALPDPRASDDTWFQMGGIYIMSGTLKGSPVIPIRSWDSATLSATLFVPITPTDVPADTEMEVYVGCDLTREMCFSRFNNIINLRAETFVPPSNPLVRQAQIGAS